MRARGKKGKVMGGWEESGKRGEKEQVEGGGLGEWWGGRDDFTGCGVGVE